MKKVKLLAAAMLSVAIIGVAFKAKEDTFKVNPKSSDITWLGKKVTGEHTGKISVSEGKIMMDGTLPKSGNIVIDMNSITCTDLTDPGYNANLVGHLKSKDFFLVEKFPTANFEFASAVDKGNGTYDLIGKMTIKGITQDMTLPVHLSEKDKILVAVGKIMINRTKFDIKYGSKSFFENIADKAIDDDFQLDFKVVASK